MKQIALTKNKIAFVSDEHYAELSKYKWHATSEGYARRFTSRTAGQKCIYMHRQVMELCGVEIISSNDVDHIDGNRLNNCAENLRQCSRAENMANSRTSKVNATSRFKGVGWHKAVGRWRAYIKVAGKYVHLGLFDDEREAALTYDAAARERFGQFACTNFHNEGGSDGKGEATDLGDGRVDAGEFAAA